jgi:hypothetical protein
MTDGTRLHRQPQAAAHTPVITAFAARTPA